MQVNEKFRKTMPIAIYYQELTMRWIGISRTSTVASIAKGFAAMG